MTDEREWQPIETLPDDETEVDVAWEGPDGRTHVIHGPARSLSDHPNVRRYAWKPRTSPLLPEPPPRCVERGHQPLVFNGTEWVRPEPNERAMTVDMGPVEYDGAYCWTYPIRIAFPDAATPEPSPPPEDEGVEVEGKRYKVDGDYIMVADSVGDWWVFGSTRALTQKGQMAIALGLAAPPIPPEVQAVVEAAKAETGAERYYDVVRVIEHREHRRAAVDALLASERASTGETNDG